MEEYDVPVLIVGGSLVGLSTALFLGSHGVRSLVVERHPGTSIYPRAASFHQRAMEMYRSVGLEDQIRTVAEQEFVQNGGTVSVESLGGEELQWYHVGANQGVPSLSPSLGLFITQIGLEPILRNRAEELGAEIRYGAEVVTTESGNDGVHALIRDRETGHEWQVRASYLVAADGNRSALRRRAGIALAGPGPISDSTTVYFHADVRSLLRGRVPSVVYVFNPHLRGFFRFAIDGDAGFLAINAILGEDGRRSDETGTDLSVERCAELLRIALGGGPDMPVKIDHVQRWEATAVAAERMQDGRMFLVGDSAHAMPPTGGFGGNTGLHDAHNLAWKLAMVLKGSAGSELLASYNAERQPVAALTVAQAHTRYVTRLEPELDAGDLAPMLDAAMVDLGYVYESVAVISEPGHEGLGTEDPRQPSGRPGTRAPHLAVEGAGGITSTLDLLGHDFVLFTGTDGSSWCEAARQATESTLVGVEAYRLGRDGDVHVDPQEFERHFGVSSDGAVLIRPDGFVAWRSRAAVTDPVHTLGAALRSVLSLGQPAESAIARPVA